MWTDTSLLLRQSLRQGIAETLNTHKPGSKSDIALIGSRRSGSTLLMQVIGHAPGVKSSDQPFALTTATNAQMQHLGWPPGGMFIAPDEQTTAKLQTYVRKMRQGEIHVREPWRFWKGDFHFRSDRLVLKTTDASYLKPLLDEAGFLTILYFRHPVPQSISCARNGWGHKLDQFASHRPLCERLLAPELRDLLDRILAEGTQIEQYVLGWCLENMPLFAAFQGGTPTIFYEDMVLDPDGTIARLVELCDIAPTPKMRAMFGNASNSVRGLSDREGADAIRSGDVQALIGRWRGKVEEADIARAQAILDHFPGCPYRASDIRPVSALAGEAAA
ncbi:Sulfotransferase family protein [Salipiger thiooxidans]|uniref:Sulfotransferase family protein n=1 Tax=Salipiger thiooxidans TaxID=282683 RepID=A0A1G7LLG5_9RHOB|nr:sulfotransferase [Salipiger thiooxidans]SDF50315.1 Sulfotransferase family protein [Salipiger thiooxidans]